MPFQPPVEQPDKLATAPVVAVPAPAEAPATPKRRGKKRPLFHLADRVFGRPLCVTEEKLETIMGVIGPRLANADSALAAFDPDDDYFDDDEQEQSDPFKDMGIACIPVYGTLVKRSTGMSAMSGMTSYESLGAKLQAALADTSVKGIILDVDSPGGESDGMFDFADQIYQARGQKPMYACCNDQMCSAAYAIGCAADRIYTSRTGMLGSVGCYMVHVDQSQYDAQKGIKYTFIAAGARKVDGNSHEPLSKDAKSEMTAEVNRIRGMFAEMVARNRNVSLQSVMDTEAGVQFASAAIPLFADQMGGCMDAAADMVKLFSLDAPDAAAQVAAEVPASSVPLPSLNVFIPGGKYSIVNGILVPAQPAPQAPLVSIAADKMASLLMPSMAKHAFGPRAAGWADYECPEEISANLFGHPGAVLAVRRSATAASLAVDPSRRISMLVVPYDGSLSTNLGGFREVYERGCFAQGLDNDPRALFNHDEACVLGRKSAGTARFWEDAAGVHVEADAPETQWADDLIVSMRRGDITNSSAAFWILQQRWESRNGERVRVVEKAMLRDASVLAFAAYETTRATVAAASASVDAPGVSATGAPAAIASARLRILRLR